MKSRSVSKCRWFGPGRIQFGYDPGPGGGNPRTKCAEAARDTPLGPHTMLYRCNHARHAYISEVIAHWAELKRLRAARAAEVRQLKAEDAHAERIARMSVGCVRVPWDLRVRVVINY